MKLHLDTFSGIAGNMFLGALLDAGLPARALREDLAGLGVDHTLRIQRVKRGALAARYVSVGVPRKKAKRGGAHADGHHHGRHYDEIRRQLDRARLRPAVRDTAQAIFAELAQAEAHVHGLPVERVHFHEVGAVDAMVDVAGAAIAVDRLEITRVTAAPPALGHGMVDTAHGKLPLPAPATCELLRGIPTVPADAAFETVTPTGAAILRVLAEAYGPLPALVIERIGHGAGNDRPGPVPNILRAILGRDAAMGRDRVVVLETNLDDYNPEHFDYLMERLFEAGALDVTLQNVQGKKNRPGFLVRVLASPARRASLAALLFAETPTLGVRTQEWDRLLLDREIRRTKCAFGTIRVKVARYGDRREVSAEYDDCKKAAKRHGVALRDVVRAAEDQARADLAKLPRSKRG